MIASGGRTWARTGGSGPSCGCARAAAAHVIALGHRRVAILTDRLSAVVPGTPTVLRGQASTDYGPGGRRFTHRELP